MRSSRWSLSCVCSTVLLLAGSYASPAHAAPSDPVAATTANDGGPQPANAAELALRGGPSFVTGEVEKDVNMVDHLGVPFTLGADLGYRINEKIYIGGLWVIGAGLVRPEPCPTGFRCPGPAIISDLGGVFRYHLTPIKHFAPWLGAGIALAVEGSNAKRTEYVGGSSSSFCIVGCGPSRVDYDQSFTRFGLDGLLEAGVDYRVSPRLGIGLSLSVFFGKYFETQIRERKNGSETSSTSRAAGGSMHTWIFPAIHFVFDFVPPPKTPPPPPTTTPQPGGTPTPTTPPASDPNEITL